MAGIQDIGNGLGYVYMVAVNGSTIQSWCPNNNISIRSFRQSGNVVSPFAAKKSAYGTLTFTTGTAGTGSITGVAVNGVDQIPGNILVTGLTDDECAELVAAAVNSFTPGSGYNYTAVAIGPTVYFYAPPIAGATPNGYAILLSDTGAVVTYTTEAFTGGSDQSGTYDDVAGSRFFLNADYGPNGISGELPADPESLTNSIEITKFFIVRGQQLGIFSKDIQASSYTISGIDRSGFVTKIFIQPQTGNTQTIVKLSAEDFVDGDIVFLQSLVSTDAITVESAPVVSVPVVGNIYLTNNVPWTNLSSSSIMLQFKYDATLGPIFVEVSRSMTDIRIEKSVFVTPNGDDSTAKPYFLNRPYLTLDAAKAAATAGDTIIVYPGTYTADAQLSKEDVIWYFMDGAVVGTNTFSLFDITTFDVTVLGNGVFVGGSYFMQNNAGSGNFFCRAKSLTGSQQAIAISGAGDTNIVAQDFITGENGQAIYFNAGASGNAYIKAYKITSSNNNGATWTTGTPAIAVIVLNAATITANIIIECEKIIPTGQQACVGLGSAGLGSGGSLTIICPNIINRCTTFAVPAIYATYGINYLKVIGNIYADGAGSLTDGLMVGVADLANPVNIDFVGDIYTEEGMSICVLSNSQSVVNFVGNIYSKTQNLPSGTAATVPCAVFVKEGAAGATVYSKVSIRGSINQFQAGSGCIYKGMGTFGGADVDNYMELIGTKLYVDDGVTNSILGEAPVGPAVNEIIAIGCIASVADDANVDIIGVALTVSLKLKSFYPPSFNV